MSTIDLIRLATERAEQTGDIGTPEFHEAVATLVSGLNDGTAGPLNDIHASAKVTANALRSAAKAQMTFRELLGKPAQ